RTGQQRHRLGILLRLADPDRRRPPIGLLLAGHPRVRRSVERVGTPVYPAAADLTQGHRTIGRHERTEVSMSLGLKNAHAPRGTSSRARSGGWVVVPAVVVAGLVPSACGADSSSAGPTTAPAKASSLPVDSLRTTVREAMSELQVPGAVVLVASPDEQWLEAFGTRTLKGIDPVTTEDSFRIGSITKTMTGTVILRLVQEGKLKLDDPVSKFYPGIPNGDAITIAGLLDMRSGLTSHTQLEVNRAMDDERARAWTPEELLAVAAAQPMTSPPANDTSTPTPTPFCPDPPPPNS